VIPESLTCLCAAGYPSGRTAASAGTRRSAVSGPALASRLESVPRAEPSPAPTLSAVVTCYRDAPALRPMHGRLTAVFAALGVEYEILFVNDAARTTRGGPRGADESGPPRPRRRALRNFGSQSVSQRDAARRGDAVILLDGDLQDPPDSRRILRAVAEGHDVVYGPGCGGRGARRSRSSPAASAGSSAASPRCRCRSTPRLRADGPEGRRGPARLPETDQFCAGSGPGSASADRSTTCAPAAVRALDPRPPQNVWWARKASTPSRRAHRGPGLRRRPLTALALWGSASRRSRSGST
jgi:hypothetical protein